MTRIFLASLLRMRGRNARKRRSGTDTVKSISEVKSLRSLKEAPLAPKTNFQEGEVMRGGDAQVRPWGQGSVADAGVADEVVQTVGE